MIHFDIFLVVGECNLRVVVDSCIVIVVVVVVVVGKKYVFVVAIASGNPLVVVQAYCISFVVWGGYNIGVVADVESALVHEFVAYKVFVLCKSNWSLKQTYSCRKQRMKTTVFHA